MFSNNLMISTVGGGGSGTIIQETWQWILPWDFLREPLGYVITGIHWRERRSIDLDHDPLIERSPVLDPDVLRPEYSIQLTVFITCDTTTAPDVGSARHSLQTPTNYQLTLSHGLLYRRISPESPWKVISLQGESDSLNNGGDRVHPLKARS